MKYSVIEHQTRGWYTGSEYGPLKEGGYGWIPHFAWSILGSDDRVEKMFSNREVQKELDKIPEKVRAKCQVKEIKH